MTHHVAKAAIVISVTNALSRNLRQCNNDERLRGSGKAGYDAPDATRKANHTQVSTDGGGRAMYRLIRSGLLCVLVTGCASAGERGWQGSGAMHFDAAELQCQSGAARQPETRAAAFESCMARLGWRRL